MISHTLAKMLFREHKRRRIENVLCLGRQTIGLSYEEAQELMRQEGIISQMAQVEYDNVTRGAQKLKRTSHWITDRTFFDMLGVSKVASMDITDYEGADIIQNLNYPIPDALHGRFDFIIDGGTFDHLFDIKTAFENVVKLLADGGRIFQWNAAANYAGTAYVSFGPDLFWDYYTQNGFDTRVYLAENKKFTDKKWQMYQYKGGSYSNLCSRKEQVLVVLAEKGRDATWGIIPIQWCYVPKATRTDVVPHLQEDLSAAFFRVLSEQGFICCLKKTVAFLVKKAYVKPLRKIWAFLKARLVGHRDLAGFIYLGK